ncbi:hypothetical protein F5Y15DRAFT_412867 [Xylariaceae sp. FL0016]|nr:hypothetical protein F5Y15DRAFT_412867 [Xylariaceae sp. FL0016]
MPPPSITPDRPVLIIGAGVAGLILAQGLRLRSVPFRLFERHPRSRSAQGHRFRIAGDGQAALQSVLSPPLRDLLRRTAPDASRFAPRYVDAATLRYPDPAPAGGTDSLPVDRTWIRRLALLDIEDAVEYGKEFASYDVVVDDDDGQVCAHFADGSAVQGRLLVGADGVKSRVRRQLQPDRKLLDLERWVMWGRTPLTDELKRALPDDMLSWCMYLDHDANVQTVVEPMTWARSERLPSGSGSEHLDISDYVYWVVCTATSQYMEHLPKTADEKKTFLERVTETWHPALKRLLSSALMDQTACIPVLSSKPDIELQVCPAGQTGCVTIIGDAAHAMSPMGGSGGDTAVQNAAELARTIAEEGITRVNLTAFEARMAAKAQERIEHSFRGGQKFWRGKEWQEYREVDI